MNRTRRLLNGFHWYTIGKLRKLYGWVLSWANSKYASVAFFVVAFIESSFFPVPPDALLLVLGISKPKKSFWYAFIGTIGSVLGGLLGYYIGWALFASIGEWILNSLHLHDEFILVGKYFTENAFLTILGAAFTPIPYKVFTIAGGFWSINLFTFFIASLIGRGCRFFIEAALMYFFGAKIAKYIDRYFAYVSLAIFVIIVLVVIAIRYFY